MLTNLIYYVFIPSLAIAVVLVGVQYYLISYRHKGLPRALAEGFSGSNYVLTRGRRHGVSDFFYDIDLSLTDHKHIDAIVDFFVSTIQEIQRRYGKINRLVFIEKDSGPVGSIALLGLLTEKLRISSLVIRTRRRLSVNSIKGDFGDEKRNVVIISDVATSGGGIKSAMEKLEFEGANVLSAIVLVSRMKTENLESLKIPLFCAFNITEKYDLEKEPIKSFIGKKMKNQNYSFELEEAA